MPTEQSSEQFTEQEIAAFVEKLEAWRGTLEEKEQDLLAAVLLSALEPRQRQDVQGYFIGGMLDQLAQQLQPKPAPRRRFEDTTKELESQDKLGNFEIQKLMN